MREARGESGGGNKKNKKRKFQPMVSKRAIKAIQSIADSLTKDKQSEGEGSNTSDESDDEDETVEMAGNRKNPALSRQNKKAKK